MDKDIFAERRLNDPQGVIDDLLAQTGRQGKAIYELNKEVEKLNKEIEKLKA